MHPFILPFLALPLLAASQRDLPPCVSTCIENNLMSSQCDGDEKGAALDRCTCATLFGSLMVSCIQDCSPADQGAYAASIPETCRDTLFPDAEAVGGSGTTAGADAAATTTAEGGSTASETASTTASGEPATGTEQTTGETETETPGGGGGVGREVPVVLAAGLFAVLLL
ncbi:hypothetical protein ACHAQH_007203 [Verticillium albo-atrum]